jgi:hypothetical protein
MRAANGDQIGSVDASLSSEIGLRTDENIVVVIDALDVRDFTVTTASG